MFDVTLSLAPAAAAADGGEQQQEGQQEEGGGSSTSSPGVRVRSSTVVLRRDFQEIRALHLALTNLLASKVRVLVRMVWGS